MARPWSRGTPEQRPDRHTAMASHMPHTRHRPPSPRAHGAGAQHPTAKQQGSITAFEWTNSPNRNRSAFQRAFTGSVVMARVSRRAPEMLQALDRHDSSARRSTAAAGTHSSIGGCEVLPVPEHGDEHRLLGPGAGESLGAQRASVAGGEVGQAGRGSTCGCRSGSRAWSAHASWTPEPWRSTPRATPRASATGRPSPARPGPSSRARAAWPLRAPSWPCTRPSAAVSRQESTQRRLRPGSARRASRRRSRRPRSASVSP